MYQGHSEKVIRIFDLQYSNEFRQLMHEGLDQILDRAYLTNDNFVRKFEVCFSEFLNTPSVCMVSTGTAALEVAFRSLNIGGKNVVIPANTFVATAQACLIAGGIPKLLDVNQFGSLSFESLSKLKPQLIGAVVIVHIGGIIHPDTLKIIEWCRHHSIAVVEDCAHAHGSSLNGVAAGLLGDVGAYSFHLTKTITCGEGGAVVSKNPEIIEKAISFRQFGKSAQNELEFDKISGNYKLTELQGLMGALDLARAAARIQRRNEIHKIYKTNLMPQGFEVLSHFDESTCGYYKTIVISEIPRVKIKQVLEKNNVALTGGVYNIPLYRQPIFRESSMDSDFPNAQSFCEKHFCPPCYPELSDDDVLHVCDILNSIRGEVES